MRIAGRIASASLPLLLVSMCGPPSRAQGPVPVITPIIANTAVPIIVHAVKPKTSGIAKFQGTVMNANIAQITVRAQGNDLAIRTFPLSEAAAAAMQKIVDKGGYQYGDKVTVLYDLASTRAIRIKGKPSKAL